MARFIFFAFILFPFLGISQNTFLFEHYSQETGLSQGTGYAIAEYDDFKWFGTQDGLNRFDGYDFKVFRAEGKKSLNNSFVQSLLADSNGKFWIGTGSGINLYDKKTETFQKFKNVFKIKHLVDSVSIKKIFEDPKHNIWIMTEEKGLFCLDLKTKQIDGYLSKEKSLFEYCFTPDGTLWISSYDAIYHFDEQKKQFIIFDIPQKTKTTLFRGIASDKDGNVWVGTYEDGVYVISQALKNFKIKHFTAQNGLSSNDITCLLKDRMNRIWIGSRTGGISVFNPNNETFRHIIHNKNDSRSLAENNIWQLYEDKQGIVWVGLSGKGIDKYDPLKFQFGIIQKDENQANNTLPDNMIFRLFGQNDNLYIGTETGGVAKYNINTHHFNQFLNNIEDPTKSLTKEIRNILSDQYNNIWIANWKGLCQINSSKNRIIPYPLQVQRKIQYLFDAKLIQNKKNNSYEIWVGGEETLERFDLTTKKWKNWVDISALYSISNFTIRSIYQDKFLNVWIGTLEHGLILYEAQSQTIKFFTANTGLDCANIRTFYEDKSSIWVGTDCGLFEIDLQTSKILKHYNTAKGLPNNVIYGILKDEQGFFWLSSNKGLSKLSIQNGSIKNYDLQDGLQSNEFNTGCAYKHSNGTMFFGGVNGINYFISNDLKLNKFIPPIKITKVIVSDSIYLPNQESITLKSDQNFISFEFAALNFSNSHKNEYQYQLEGVDTKWVNARYDRTANYTKLSPGEYTFRVKGCNNDGIWNEVPASILIIIKPPFWMTWWFKVLLMLMLLGGIYGIYNYQIYSLKIQQEHDLNVVIKTQELERKRFAKELHDGIGSNLSVLKLYLSSLGDKKFSIDVIKERSLNVLKQTLDEVREFIHEMHPRSLKELGLAKAISEMIEHINQGSSLNITFHCQNLPKKIPQTIEINLFRVLQELLQNAIKHSKAKQVSIELKFENQILTLNYSDNGQGFDDEILKNKRGNGLVNIQQRIEILKGTFNVATSAETGTFIKIEVPVSNLT